jgi:hypothetical protein
MKKYLHLDLFLYKELLLMITQFSIYSMQRYNQ